MIIATRKLAKHFQLKGTGVVGKGATLRAVDGIDLEVPEGSVVGVVGESGSGKSTLGRMLVGLLEPTAGVVLFDIPNDVLAEYDRCAESGQMARCADIEKEYSVHSKKGGNLRAMRRKMGIIFQDPYSSLDPRLHVQDIITEPMIATGFQSGDRARETCFSLLAEVGLPRDFAFRYPHELSGGQRQRVALARAISTLPKFLVLDEPTSALDVSVQAQILSLLKGIRTEYNISMLLITHNIAVVAYLADRVNVMYAGNVMESGAKKDVILAPTHPYTKALISAVPGRAKLHERAILTGDPPNLVAPPNGCRFHPRCPVAFKICGWTADEVATDLEYLVQGREYSTPEENAEVFVKDDSKVLVRGAKAARIEEIASRESGSYRSLSSIARVENTPDGSLVTLAKSETLEMFPLPDQKKVSCLLYSPAMQEGAKT